MDVQSLEPNLTRRAAFAALAAAGPVLASAGAAQAQAQAQAITDVDIFNFALNLEYVEAEYYNRAVYGQTLSAEDVGPNPGPVNGGRRVNFATPLIRTFAEELAYNELAHVRLYRRVLGPAAVSRPTIDLAGAFAAAGRAAGIPNFDPFADEVSFLLGGLLIEDVGVTAYKGAAPLIQSKANLAIASSVLAAEAYHMGMARSVLYRSGQRARNAANAISNARDQLDGPSDKDQGIVLEGRANFVPTDANGIAFSRTPQEVLRIVYLTPQAGVSGGGFLPQGANGTIRTT
jgi:hypothetical protein